MSTDYWLTISVPAANIADADHKASEIAKEHGGRVVQVDSEPPQGSTIVGDMHEDAL